MKYSLFVFIFLLSVYFAFSENIVTILTVENEITQITSMYIRNGLKESEENKSKAVIIRLNTPGGLLESTREIVTLILESKVPVFVYVSPSGAHAGSAGMFITLSSHIAIMAPGTNIGASHPVNMNGTDIDDVMKEKIENDVAAFARSIAQKKGKNVEWAEKAVRESVSASADEALELGVIDLICNNISDILKVTNGKEIELKHRKVLLNFNDTKLLFRDMNWKENFLSYIANPNIAFILILIGIYGLFFELKSPGSIFPGAVGTISLLLAAFSLQMLPINYVGLGLIILSFALFLLEIFIISYGFLTIGGIISFTIGSIMLIDSPYEFMKISLSLIITASILTALFFSIIIYFGLKAQKVRKVSGKFSLIGENAIVKDTIMQNKQGKVLVQGEIWQAESDEKLDLNEKVVITDINGMIAKVAKKII